MSDLCKFCRSPYLDTIFNIELFKIIDIGNLSHINIVSYQNCGFCFNNKITQDD